MSTTPKDSKDSTERVSLEEAMRRFAEADATNASKITRLERQIDDILKSFTEQREENANSTKAELQNMTEKIDSIQSLSAAYLEEAISRSEDKERKWNHMYAEIMNKLDHLSKPAVNSTPERQNKMAEKEEFGAGKSWVHTVEETPRHTFTTTPYTATAHWGHPSGTVPYQIEAEVKQTTAIPSVLPLNGIKHSIIVPPASAAPAFYGKHSESPTQFLIRVQEYAESVQAWDRFTLLNGISQFLRESALEWYCQLRTSNRRPQTWVEFEDLFLAQFNSPVRKARQDQEWHQCKQKENETINEFLVRLRTLWREQKPKETEPDLVKHLFCRMRNDLLNMIGVSRNASLDELITEVQQIEEILYRPAKGERLSKQIKEVETLPKKNYNDNNSRQTSKRWNNESRNYQVNEVTPNQYTNYQNQTTVAPNWSQQVNSNACYYCGGYGHWSNYCPTQYGDYRQQRNTPKSKNDQGALDERTRPAPT